MIPGILVVRVAATNGSERPQSFPQLTRLEIFMVFKVYNSSTIPTIEAMISTFVCPSLIPTVCGEITLLPSLFGKRTSMVPKALL